MKGVRVLSQTETVRFQELASGLQQLRSGLSHWVKLGVAAAAMTLRFGIAMHRIPHIAHLPRTAFDHLRRMCVQRQALVQTFSC